MAEDAGPPVAPVRPSRCTLHGVELVDEYAWLRDREDPEVIAYLEAENAFTEAAMAHTAGLQETIYEEIVGRIKETDLSVPERRGEYHYYTRTVEGQQYPIFCRRQGGPGEPEEVLLDHNELAEGHDYLSLAYQEVSPDHRYLAYAVDLDGSELFTIHVKDLVTGEVLADRITPATYSVAWASDNRTFFYTVPDEARRPHQVYRHRLGTTQDEDVLVFTEEDRRFNVSVYRMRSERFIVLGSDSNVTSEARVLEASEPEGTFRLIQARDQGHEYDIEHHGKRFFILSNRGAPNFRLLEAPVDHPGEAHWREVLPHRDDVKLDTLLAFREHLVIVGRQDALTQLWVRSLATGETYQVQHEEPIHAVFPHRNPEADTTLLRFSYTSLVTPRSVFDHDMVSRQRTLLKQEEVLGEYDPARYEQARCHAVAPDGERIPISLVHRRGLQREGRNPLLLYGYGAYGHSIPPYFASPRLSLLDRGFVFAIAHIRGGEDLGRRWYDQGKLLQKRNSFTDFIACAEHLIEAGYTSPSRLIIRGGSAGGLLVGAAANLRPELFRAVVAEVPFMDVLNTMLDDSLPLTVNEFEEWGNPQEEEYFHYIRSYSPYDNIEARDYPAMLLTAGLNDPRVSYWEPAKFAARLRHRKTDRNTLLLKTQLGAGHAGVSGRYEAYRETAFVFAFICDVMGIRE